MDIVENSVLLGWLRKLYTGALEVTPPAWLGRSRWKPELCLRLQKDKKLIAVDINISGEIPSAIYPNRR